MIKAHINGILARLMKPWREIYHKQKSKRFVGPVPSIISNNCIGGVILHDLGLQFRTPTINLFFRTNEEFVYFVKNLEDLRNLPVKEIDRGEFKGPVGKIEFNDKLIGIVFLHYKDFQTGYKKWRQRMERLDINNIVVLLESPELSPEIVEAFSEIKYKKAIISKPIQNKPDYYVPLDIYENWHPGKILEYKSMFSLKRWVDDWDYISFLNQL